jgi:hypothetical protein
MVMCVRPNGVAPKVDSFVQNRFCTLFAGSIFRRHGWHNETKEKEWR